MQYENYTKEQVTKAVIEQIKILGGDPEKDILLLTDEDYEKFTLQKLAVSLAESLVYKGTKLRKEFPSLIVSPINNIITGIEQAKLSSKTPYCMPEFSEKDYPMENPTGDKKIYIVHFNKIMMWGENDEKNSLVETLKEYGKKPCVNAPNYLLGLLVKVGKKDLMSTLTGVNYIVAAEPGNQKSLFRNNDGSEVMLTAYLCSVNRDSPIDLGTYPAGPICYENYAFLAEDL